MKKKEQLENKSEHREVKMVIQEETNKNNSKKPNILAGGQKIMSAQPEWKQKEKETENMKDKREIQGPVPDCEFQEDGRHNLRRFSRWSEA